MPLVTDILNIPTAIPSQQAAAEKGESSDFEGHVSLQTSDFLVSPPNTTQAASFQLLAALH